MFYYLATHVVPPLIPFDKENGKFHVAELSDGDSTVRSKFPSKTNIVYVGSSLGCGCGFRCRELEADAAPTAIALAQADHVAFAEYLETLFELGDQKVELFCCWSGDEAKTPLRTEACTPSQVRDPSFCFVELHKYLVTPH